MKAAFLVGVSVYDSLKSLPACAKDVSIIESLLKATENYEKIEVLKDDTNADTVKSVLRNFAKELSEQEESVEELFIYFSGHGSQSNDDVLLCCSDFNSKRPESTSLLNSELDRLARTINPELTVKVFDACQSGYQYIKDTEVFTKNWSQQSGINKLILMASCLQQQSSFADENISFFTKAFFEGAVSKKLGDDIYYRDIQSYIADSFKSYSEQTPFFVTQIDGLEVFGTTNKEIKDLQTEHKNLIQQKIKSKSLPERVLESINEIESYFLPKEEVDNLLKQIEPSKLKLKLSDEINQSLYKEMKTDSVTLEDISSAKFVANEVSNRKWRNDCFITIEKESYKVRQLREDLPFWHRMSIDMDYLGSRKKLDESHYETVTRYRPSNIKVNYKIPFDCLRLQVKSSKLCLHPWHSYLYLIPARTYCVLAMGFVKLDRHSWDEFQLKPSKIEWLFKELLWRDWAEHPPLQTLISETEQRIKQDIIQTSGITIDDEYEDSEEEESS